MPNQKCANPACTCPATSGEYCSPQCEESLRESDTECQCGHADCRGQAEAEQARGAARG